MNLSPTYCGKPFQAGMKNIISRTDSWWLPMKNHLTYIHFLCSIYILTESDLPLLFSKLSTHGTNHRFQSPDSPGNPSSRTCCNRIHQYTYQPHRSCNSFYFQIINAQLLWNSKRAVFLHYLFNTRADSDVGSCVKGRWLIFEWHILAPVLTNEYAIHGSLQDSLQEGIVFLELNFIWEKENKTHHNILLI